MLSDNLVPWDIDRGKRPGAPPTNGISIEFEIQSKFGVL